MAGDLMMARDRLIIFTRYPKPGHTKTRLIGTLGDQGAADLHRQMTERTVRIARQVRDGRGTEIEICFTGAEEERMREWLGADLGCRLQVGHDLGERMANAFQHALDEGCRRVVLIGTDCPGFTAEILTRAFSLLEQKDVVIGPTEDGGYCLVGMTGPLPKLFSTIPWGTDAVLETTLDALKATGVSWILMDKLRDIDTPEDLAVWENVTGATRNGKPSISVVIPALNEAKAIGSAIHSARRGNPLEIIVADGGSDDGTLDIAKQYADRVISCPRGKSRQMNAGAEISRGDYLLFLHADTVLPYGYEQQMRDILSKEPNVCGAFRLRIEGDFPGKHFVEAMTAFRSDRMHMPYGDQALFVRRSDFLRLAGFKDMAIMEDYDFVLRARRLGRVAMAGASVLTSGRRWQRLGALRTTAINQILIAGYHIGVAPQTLADYYRRKR